MRVLVIVLGVWLASAAGVSAAEVPAPANALSRQGLSLNGEWQYIVDPQEVGYYDYRLKPVKNGFFMNQQAQHPTDLIEYDFSKARTMQVPGDWNTQDERLFFYEGTVWLKRSFDYRPAGDGRQLLYFAAANYHARVWLNGQWEGEHEGGFTPFCFDVTDHLRKGDNTVVVMVDCKRHQDNVPTQIFDWWNYGGLTRDVLLLSVPSVYIDDYYVQLERGNQRLLNCWVQLSQPVSGQEVSISIPELKIQRTLHTDAQGRASIQLKCKPQLWTPEQPKRYQVAISQGGETVNDEIGLRTIETRGKQILLNGQPVFLRGVSMHEEAPYRQGRAWRMAEADTLLTWAKEMGCNYVRLAHYPHNERMVREAERLGVMVWSEVPVYWTISWTNPQTYANAERQLHDMIRRDHNRANVVIWSIANETPHSAERDAFLGRLARYARQQDSTRLISMAMEVTEAKNNVNRLQDNLHELVDVVSFNEYVGWYRNVADAPKMVWEIPYEKPVIISEFGGGAVAGRHGDQGQRWTEEFQEELYRQNLAMLQKIDGLAGMSPWILVDFMAQRRLLDGTQDYFNRKGLVSDKGIRKKAYWVMKDFYENKRYEK